jgi:predicted GH43/DUF377 family glycosyl hydrolase
MVMINAAISVVNIPDTEGFHAALLDDDPLPGETPVPADYNLNVLGGEFAVVGVRPQTGDDFDIEVYTDTTYTNIIESSTTSGDSVDFVALDKDTWTSPPSRGLRVTKGSTNYEIEMENEIESYTTSDTWTGNMDTFPGNPVLDVGPSGSWNDEFTYAPTVIYDGTIYHMWYGGFDGSNVKIGYANSNDGISWTTYSGNPVLDLGSSGSWDDQHVYFPCVIYDGTTFHMWYSGKDGINHRIGYATSTDAISWDKYSANPVLDIGPSGAWDSEFAFSPEVIYDGSIYHMWYSGYDGSKRRIGYATSPDRVTWTKSGTNPVLDIGPSGSWDDEYACIPRIVYDSSIFHMWYTGNDGSTYRIGYATSTDGVSWVKSLANPVLEFGPSGFWDDRHLLYPDIYYDGSTLHMWYSGGDGTNIRIGYASSTDIDEWKKHDANPVLNPGSSGSWDDTFTYCPTVLFDGTSYRMWYSGFDGSHVRVGYATSPDGVLWTKYAGNPVLDLGPSGSWEDYHVHYPYVLYDGTVYHMWYSGNDGTHYRIGYATSSDGITWTKYGGNPVLDLGPSGSFDDFYVSQASILYDGSTYQLWYSALQNGGIGRIGYATSSDGITWAKHPSNPVVDTGPSGSWDDTRTYSPDVITDGTIYHMMYSGYDGSTYLLGYASSFDGITWTKNPQNPTITQGPSGSWDDDDVGVGSFLYDGTKYQMWYTGDDGSIARTGLATYSIEWRKLTARTEVLDACEITGINSGSEYTIELEVPSTADLDVFIYDTTGGRNDAVASSTNTGPGIDESLTFLALSSGDYLLVITNENGGTGEYTIIQNQPPVAEAGADQTIFEGDEAVFDVTESSDPDGEIVKYELDFGDGTSYIWETSASSGKDILVFVTEGNGSYNRTIFDGELPTVLTDEGFNVDISGADQISEITTSILNNYDQLWIMSTRWATSGGIFSQPEIDAILNFQENGGAMLIMADHTIGGGSYATDANQISSNYDVTFSGFVNHGHKDIDPFLISHPLNENLDHIWGHWSESYITESNPDVEVIATHIGKDMIAVYDVIGEGRIVFDTSFVRAEDKEDTNHNITCAENIQYMKNIAKWLGEGTEPEEPPLIHHAYGDDGHGTDGIYTITLTVTDNEGAVAQDSCIVTVLNVDPTLSMESPIMDVEISLRLAGSKWSNVMMTLYENDSAIGFIEVERWPGNPDNNPTYGGPLIPLRVDLTRSYSAIVTYDPYPDSGDEINGDQPNNGKDKNDNAGNPVWVVVRFPDGSEERVHHTFNTQQSKKRGSTHWNHIDPWEVNVMDLLVGHSFEVSAQVTDPGSDDLTPMYSYGSQVITKEYLNNPPNPDPYPSPQVNPRYIMDFTSIIYEGAGTLILIVEDDDGGDVSTIVVLA